LSLASYLANGQGLKKKSKPQKGTKAQTRKKSFCAFSAFCGSKVSVGNPPNFGRALVQSRSFLPQQRGEALRARGRLQVDGVALSWVAALR
jgi:hypothetical protein